MKKPRSFCIIELMHEMHVEYCAKIPIPILKEIGLMFPFLFFNEKSSHILVSNLNDSNSGGFLNQK